jgi:hypothetical protein
MKKLKLLLISLILFSAFSLSSSPIKAAPDTSLSFQPSTLTPTVGDSFTVPILIDTGTNEVIGAELYINFDSSRLSASSISAGSFFTDPEAISPVISNTNGTISYTLYLSPQSQAETGQGTLATITFKALSAGSANISFSSDTIIGAINEGGVNALASSPSKTITVQTSSSSGTGGTSTSTTSNTTTSTSSTTSSNGTSTQTTTLPETGFSLPTLIMLLSGGLILLVSGFLILL